MGFIDTKELEQKMKYSPVIGKYPRTINYIMEHIVPSISEPTTTILKRNNLRTSYLNDGTEKKHNFVWYECQTCHQCYSLDFKNKIHYCCNCGRKVLRVIDMTIHIEGWD